MKRVMRAAAGAALCFALTDYGSRELTAAHPGGVQARSLRPVAHGRQSICSIAVGGSPASAWLHDPHPAMVSPSQTPTALPERNYSEAFHAWQLQT
jgi:fermentation-respiration switch protein FrsA (DUF1100 family)